MPARKAEVERDGAGGVAAVERALTIAATLAEAGEPLTLAALARRTGYYKSTLLRLLVGLDQPTSGAFWYGVEPEEKPDASAVRVMFQEPRLLPWARVLSNVEVGLGRARKEKDARERALATLTGVGLGDRRDEWPSVLSGGQRQRVALARALVSRPRVLAFDEPLGALDALTREQMIMDLQAMWLRLRNTVLFITHGIDEAVFLADRVLVMSPRPGRLQRIYEIDLPRPRPLEVTTRPHFIELVSAIKGSIDHGAGANAGSIVEMAG